MDFVRKAVKAIGQTAIKIESAAERCVNVLLDLISTRVSYVVQEAVVVMKVQFLLLVAVMPLLIVSKGHFPKVPFNIRRRHTDTLREPRRAR